MFVGHAALALAVKRRIPHTSLGLLYAAAQGLDLLWPPLLLLGVERLRIEPGITASSPLAFTHYPWSHSLLMTLVWSGLAVAVMRWRGATSRTAAWVGGLVASHWVLDLVTHRPDLPLWPGPSPYVGLGLWNSIPGTLVVEGGLFVAGIVIYLRTTRARDRIGRWGFWAFIALQLLLWLPGPWAPPPPSPAAVAWAALGVWLFVLLAGWFDRHRESVVAPTGGT